MAVAAAWQHAVFAVCRDPSRRRRTSLAARLAPFLCHSVGGWAFAQRLGQQPPPTVRCCSCLRARAQAAKGAGRQRASALTSSRFFASASLRVSTFLKNAALSLFRRPLVELPQAARFPGGSAERGASRPALGTSTSAASRQQGAAKCAFLCFLILTSAHRARSGARRTAGMSVRPPASEPVSFHCASWALPRPLRLAALNPASAARSSKAGSQCRPPMRVPLAAPYPSRHWLWLPSDAPPRAMAACAPRRPSAPPQSPSRSQHAATTRPRLALGH